MMETLEEFLVRRIAELDEAEAPLLKKLDQIRVEREQVRRAAAAAAQVALPSPAETVENVPTRRTIPERTIKEAVVEILDGMPKGLTSQEILSNIQLIYGMPYPRSSLSPQLSRLKAEGRVVLMGKVWFLPKHFIELGGDPNQSLFEDEGSEVSNADPEAQGVKAAPGGGE